MWFGYNCQIIFCHFFRIVNLSNFLPQYVGSGYLLWAQLLLQFYTDCFETVHVFSSWYEDVHVQWRSQAYARTQVRNIENPVHGLCDVFLYSSFLRTRGCQSCSD